MRKFSYQVNSAKFRERSSVRRNYVVRNIEKKILNGLDKRFLLLFDPFLSMNNTDGIAVKKYHNECPAFILFLET